MTRTNKALSVMVVITLSGCAGASSPESSSSGKRAATKDFVDAAGYRAALQKAYASYTWPADTRPDLAALAMKSGPPPGARISADGGAAVLSIVNRCAWYRSWNAARDRRDAVAARAALKVMTEVLPTFGASDPSGQQLARETAQRAALGDPSLARQYVQANCDATKFLP